jgi:hypothetical protein
MDGEAVADASERIQEFTFARQSTAWRGARKERQTAAHCECADLLRQPGVTREPPVNKL